jgi:RNA polymerase sigma-70 factor (ECF subfamily)
VDLRAVDQQLAALEAMWRSHRDAVWRTLASLARSIDLADDLLQETYLRARAGISRYRGGDSRAWLTAIARNVYHGHMRQRFRRAEIPLDSCRSADGSPDLAYDRHDLLAIRQALAMLAPALRTALIMKHYAGFTYEEIARHQRCPVGTVKWRVSEALDRLRKTLQPERRPTMARCAEVRKIGLADYVYAVLPDDEAAGVRAHLAECASCREEAEGLSRVVALLDALEGDRRQMHFVELDQEGGVTLYATSAHLNEGDRPLDTLQFQSDTRPDSMYQDGEEIAFEVAPTKEFGRRNYAATLRHPVPPGSRLSLLSLYATRAGDPGAARRLGDARFRFSWKQGPSSTDEFAYIQAIRLPAGARFLSADPQPDETRGDAAVTLVWRRVLPPGQFFECTLEYRLDDQQ